MSEDQVSVDAADLRTLLNQQVMHSHQRPGIWNWDNGPKANMPCEECAARVRLKAALTPADSGPISVPDAAYLRDHPNG